MVEQTIFTPSRTRPNFSTGVTLTTILRLDKHAGKPTTHKLTEIYFDNKYYECFDREGGENHPWFIWKSTTRRVISKICKDEVVEYDLLGGTWSSHKGQVAGSFGPKSYYTQDGYEECWMSV